MSAEICSYDGAVCPHCKHLHETDLEDLINYWGCQAAASFTCHACGKDFEVIEEVVRTWRSRKKS